MSAANIRVCLRALQGSRIRKDDGASLVATRKFHASDNFRAYPSRRLRVRRGRVFPVHSAGLDTGRRRPRLRLSRRARRSRDHRRSSCSFDPLANRNVLRLTPRLSSPYSAAASRSSAETVVFLFVFGRVEEASRADVSIASMSSIRKNTSQKALLNFFQKNV